MEIDTIVAVVIAAFAIIVWTGVIILIVAVFLK